MNDVRQVFDELLTGPVPPMASSEVMLAVARRTEQRRRRVGLTIGAGGLAVLTVAVAVAVGISSVGRSTPGPDAVADGPATSASGAATPTRSVPSGGRVRNSADILDGIAAALPADHTIRRAPAGDDVSARDIPDLEVLRPGQGLRGVRLLDAVAVVYAGDRAGEIAVTLRDARAAADPPRRTEKPGNAELCTARTPPPGPWPPRAPEGGDCRTVLVGDVAVRVRTARFPDPTALDGDVPAAGGGGSGPGRTATDPPDVTCTSATRFAEGVEVTVRWCPAVASFALAESRAPLTGSVFTDQRLAELAAGPTFLPAQETGR
ncbi:hypothetical protein ACFP2T_20405 [Plantactinospora solaniradicis]|uniref:Uncharacterized protein n=1 Tax=Plantactinospora solaniradicis TaxID=1723736 RepID=A0ABW1KCQ7_9ACTN